MGAAGTPSTLDGVLRSTRGASIDAPGSVVAVAASEREQIRQDLEHYGSEAGQFTVLGPDPWYVLRQPGRAGFANFLALGPCLISWRSPVAPAADQGPLLDALRDYARARHAQLIVIGCNDRVRTSVRRRFHSLWIGSECFLDVANWTTAGGRRQKVRWALRHAEKVGVRWRELTPATDPEEAVILSALEESWIADRPERGTDSFLRNEWRDIQEFRRYFLAEDESGPLASLTCSPIDETGWYLQDVVRVARAPRGALEGAMAFALATFREEGSTLASNGVLPFWRSGNDSFPTPHLGLLERSLIRFFDGRYRFAHINQFRAKFEPDHVEPSYVLRSHRFITPRVALALKRLLTTRPPAA